MRAIDNDFEDLKGFLGTYTLKATADDPLRLQLARSAHKAYLPFLQLWAIVLEAAKTDKLAVFTKAISPQGSEFAHLRECFSDVGSGLFCCLHGAYKPGHMALRSSIENFLRCVAGPFEFKALTTKSIYELFDIAKGTEPFQGARKGYLERLRGIYSELCKFSHSASLEHMAGIHALAHFPSFDEQAFSTWQTLAKNTMTAMVCTVLLGDRSLYLTAHYQAKELLDHLLPQGERTAILKGTKEA